MRKMRLIERALPSLIKVEGLETGSNGDGNENTTTLDGRRELCGPSTAPSSTHAVGNLATTRLNAPSLVILRENGSSSARRRINPVNGDSWEETITGPEQKENTRPAGMMGVTFFVDFNSVAT